MQRFKEAKVKLQLIIDHLILIVTVCSTSYFMHSPCLLRGQCAMCQYTLRNILECSLMFGVGKLPNIWHDCTENILMVFFTKNLFAQLHINVGWWGRIILLRHNIPSHNAQNMYSGGKLWVKIRITVRFRVTARLVLNTEFSYPPLQHIFGCFSFTVAVFLHIITFSHNWVAPFSAAIIALYPRHNGFQHN